MQSFRFTFHFTLLALLACVFLILGASCAKPVEEKAVLRVGTSGDYEPFSMLDDRGDYVGYEIALAKAFAEDQGMELKFVPFRWPELLNGLEADEYDLAMSGVTIRKDRSLKAQFTVPTATSGAVVIIPSGSELRSMNDVDRENVRLGVNAGGHLERVTRQRFLKATITTSNENLALPDLLKEQKIDALVTDTMEAPFWLERLEGAQMLAPFTQDLKAALVRPDRGDLAAQLNLWLVGQEASGRLSDLRKLYLPSGNDLETADPFFALLAAMKERLSLMTDVAEAKRATGKAVEDLEQEARVIEAAVAGVSNEAVSQGVLAPNARAVEQFFRAQIEAAKAIQRYTMTQPSSSPEPTDLVNDLRPALVRISTRINQLVCLLPEAQETTEVQVLAHVRESLTFEGMTQEDVSLIADALWELLSAFGVE